MPIIPGQSLDHLRAIVQAFGASAGLPFLQLDDQGSTAVRLGSGGRLELEYAASSDRLFAYVEVLVAPPQESLQWAAIARQSVQLMSNYGFSLGLGEVEGSDRLLAMASLPAANLSEDTLGDSLLELVAAAGAVGDRLRELPHEPATTGDTGTTADLQVIRV